MCSELRETNICRGLPSARDRSCLVGNDSVNTWAAMCPSGEHQCESGYSNGLVEREEDLPPWVPHVSSTIAVAALAVATAASSPWLEHHVYNSPHPRQKPHGKPHARQPRQRKCSRVPGFAYHAVNQKEHNSSDETAFAQHSRVSQTMRASCQQ